MIFDFCLRNSPRFQRIKASYCSFDHNCFALLFSSYCHKCETKNAQNAGKYWFKNCLPKFKFTSNYNLKSMCVLRENENIKLIFVHCFSAKMNLKQRIELSKYWLKMEEDMRTTLLKIGRDSPAVLFRANFKDFILSSSVNR